MGHIALYREWRPKTFDEVVEQKHTVAALKQAVISGNIAHAYLFSGTRGTGKTTMAQVFSRAINCLDPQNGNPCNKCNVCCGILNGSVLDVIEMDAASNNSVDTIRRLCDEIVFTPSVAKYKVYIIDEVHMLSTGAFNALLKTLEEPPSHAVFILATTEQHRIPATILSRCQRYEFRRIPIESITIRLMQIAKADGVSIDNDALRTIAQMADGALRDAISLLDQAKGSFQKTIVKEDILSLVGVVNDEFMNEMALSIVDCNPSKMLNLVENFILDGRDVIRFTIDLAGYFRNVMICKVSKNPENLVYVPTQTINEMKRIAAKLSLEEITNFIRELSGLVSDLKWSLNTRITFEIAMIRLMDINKISSVDEYITTQPKIESSITTNSSESFESVPSTAKVAENDSSDSIKSNKCFDTYDEYEKVVPFVAGNSTIKVTNNVKDASVLNYEDNDFLSLSNENSGNVIYNSDEFPDPFYTSENANALKNNIKLQDNIIPVESINSNAQDSLTDSSETLINKDTPAKTSLNISLEDKLENKPLETFSNSIDSSISDIKNEIHTENIVSSKKPEDLNVIPKFDISVNIEWPKILDEIVSMGQMTIYLFLLAAKPLFEDNTLKIIFEDKDIINHKELSAAQNFQIIKQATFKILSSKISVEILLKSQQEKKTKNLSVAVSPKEPLVIETNDSEKSENVEISESVKIDNSDMNKEISNTSTNSDNLSGLDKIKLFAENSGITVYEEE